MSEKERDLPVPGGQPDRHPVPGTPAEAGHAMNRRHALKVMAVAAAVPALSPGEAAGASGGPGRGTPAGGTDGPGAAAAAGSGRRQEAGPGPRGDAWDPDLINPVVLWERSLTEDELATLAVLCDLIIPEDEHSPSASALGAHDFIDEWVSAPYDWNGRDKVLIRGGLVWLDNESARRFGPGVRFRELEPSRQRAICDDIAYLPEAPEGMEPGARFFARVRDLTATAFYTTREGMQDLQYVGNVPLPSWGPPPPEVLRHLGLA